MLTAECSAKLRDACYDTSRLLRPSANTPSTISARFEDYLRKAVPLIARFGGRYLTRGEPMKCWMGTGIQIVSSLSHVPDMAAIRSATCEQGEGAV
jgi:hypothetical protein